MATANPTARRSAYPADATTTSPTTTRVEKGMSRREVVIADDALADGAIATRRGAVAREGGYAEPGMAADAPVRETVAGEEAVPREPVATTDSSVANGAEEPTVVRREGTAGPLDPAPRVE